MNALSISRQCLVIILFITTMTTLMLTFSGNFSATPKKYECPVVTIPETKPNMQLQMKSIINLPSWYRTGDWGLQKNESLEKLKLKFKGQDKEAVIAWNQFFFGTTKGIAIEMGAWDGKASSVTLSLETQAGWRSILIEGDPDLASHLSQNRPNALNFNVAVCDKAKTVHYMQSRSGVNGIVEFTAVGLLKTVFKELLTNGTLDYDKLNNNSRVIPVQCLPLADVLTPFDITHVNYFSLDVEGGELSILKGIDFDLITFDVISVETFRYMDKDTLPVKMKYVDDVIELLTSKGYVLWSRLEGRNSWFVSPHFQPFNNTGTK